MIQKATNYEEWLTTIANTRFMYNTMDELEDMFDNHSIHSNGIKRSFSSPQKMRSAFRDLKVEVELMTDGNLDLELVLQEYQKAWIFFRDKLYRRSNPEQVAMELLSYCYPPYTCDGVGAKKSAIYKQATEQNINIPFLLLMIMKVIPGYDSKDGDVIDLPRQFERVMQLLETHTNGRTIFNVIPAITKAREEQNKSRLMLLYHVSEILDTYKSYSGSDNFYEVSNDIKQSSVNLDIEGYWNECGGRLDNTYFWQIEDAMNDGTYFITKWHKDSENRLTGIRYTMFVIERTDGNLIYYILHPEAIKHRMKGLQYGDADHVWYQTEKLEEHPIEMPLQRVMFSGVWPREIKLTRCTSKDVISLYDRWLNHDCEVIKEYERYEYYFCPNLYAITQTHLYIPSENEGEYYKVPKSAHEGLEYIQIDDNVGTMLMNGKTYLAFDELMLYIGTSRKELEKYGIERVNCID